MNDSVPRHPEAHIMAAFVDGTLAPDEIAAVAGHLRDCADCRTVVSETARFEREEERAGSSRSNRSWWLAAAAAIAAIAIAVPLLRRSESGPASPMARLIEIAPRQHRLVEARLTGFPWARLQAPSRGNAIPDPADLKLAGAAGEVLEKTAGRNDPASRQANGVAYLLIGRRSESIAALASATTDSKDAAAWNDLAAARYAMAVQDEHPAQLPEALADVDHAVRINPRLAEALFNRALILEHLGIREQARGAWQQYLDVDPASDWSVEARAHLRALESGTSRFDPKLLESAPADQLVRAFPQEARTWSEGVLLSDWADAEAVNDSARASAKLSRARVIADALAAFNGEHLLDDAVASIERSSGQARAALVEGHRLYRSARMDYARRNVGAAETQFRRCAALFAKGGSPMAEVANYFAASAAFDENRGGEARDALASQLSRINAARHRALAAQIHWELTVCANAAGDWGSATRDSDAGTTIFRALGERANAAFLDSIGATALELIGEPDLAWARRVNTFSDLSAMSDVPRMRAILHGASFTLASVDQSGAAAAVIDLMIDGGRNGDPAQMSFAEADRARFAMRNGDRQGARRSLDVARAAASRVADPELRQTVGAQIDLADATLQIAHDPQAAIVSLDRSISLFARQQSKADLPDAYLQRARALRSARGDAEAVADYANALHEVENQRTTIRDAESRLRFLDTAGQIIEEAIDLHLSLGDVAGAFDIEDRTQVLLGMASRESKPRAVARPLASGVTLVEYAVLPHGIAAFCVSNGGVTEESVQVNRRELDARVASFAERIRLRAPIAEVRGESAALYRLLIAPLRPHISNSREIVLVPGRELDAVPFAALWDESRKQYLAEELTIRLALSASSSGEADGPLEPALVIADPPTHEPRLPASRDEAARIAALYGATLLSGEAATRAAFANAATRSALIHFAGHANSDGSGSYGALLLAGTASDSGVVGSNDVARLRLDGHPLVILAACGTFRGSALHVAGMSSLARAFLIAGARGVAGTLWEIDDDVSARLFLRFHEHLRSGMTPARALHEAQRDLLRSTDPRLAHPAAWAPVELLSNL
jgi:CHAT domain-containing protein